MSLYVVKNIAKNIFKTSVYVRMYNILKIAQEAAYHIRKKKRIYIPAKTLQWNTQHPPTHAWSANRKISDVWMSIWGQCWWFEKRWMCFIEIMKVRQLGSLTLINLKENNLRMCCWNPGHDWQWSQQDNPVHSQEHGIDRASYQECSALR